MHSNLITHLLKKNFTMSKAVSCTRTRVKDPLNCSFGDQKILEKASFNTWELSCAEYSAGLIELNIQKKNPGKALHFKTRVSRYTKREIVIRKA